MSNIKSFVSKEDIHQQACEWISKIDRGLSTQEKGQLSTWAATSETHRTMLFSIAELWDDLSALHELSGLFPLRDKEPTQRKTFKDSTRWSIAAGFAMLVLGSASWLMHSQSGLNPEASVASVSRAETALGEQKPVTLSDGSVIHLNTNSLVYIDYSDDQRHITLARGEAHFDVAHDESRPLTVVVRPVRIRQPAVSIAYLLLATMAVVDAQAAEHDVVPDVLRRWLAPQVWRRDTEGPVVSLGAEGEFDDMHLFAPCVALEDDEYRLWYCGSRDAVARRVFTLGLAAGANGRDLHKHDANPVFRFGDGRTSILTPTLLRDTAGRPIREDGQLRLWFSATDFAGGSGLHTLHESHSRDGVQWSPPSRALLEHVYAPSIIRDGEHYRMWYTDVSREPWILRHATSQDGRVWSVDETPTLVIDQPWEERRLFYPTVVKSDSVYLMWYGSYWLAHASKTAIGFSVSTDGRHWHKHPANPVLRPDASRAWESHYTTSQSVMQLADGSWRIWYASRKKPPFVNKYFAIGTAVWSGP